MPLNTRGIGFAAAVLAGASVMTGCGLIGGSKGTHATTTALPPLPSTTATAAATTTTVPTEYVIQKGDSLSKIAKQFGVTVAGIVSANNLADPDHIEEGQRIKIPPPTTTTTAGNGAPGGTTVAPTTSAPGAPSATTAKAATTTAKP